MCGGPRIREVGDGALAAHWLGRREITMSIKAIITSLALGCSTLASVGAVSAAPYPVRAEVYRDRVAFNAPRFERASYARHWWQPRYVRGAGWRGRRC
jgi:hypothetical protein